MGDVEWDQPVMTDDEYTQWLLRMLMVCGYDEDDVLGMVKRHGSEVAGQMVVEAYYRAVEEGLLEMRVIDGEENFRLTDAGLVKVAELEGRIVVDGQHR